MSPPKTFPPSSNLPNLVILSPPSTTFLLRMAMETTAPHSTPTAQVIGNAFVEQYYQIQHHTPELVHRFHQDSSFLSRPDSNGLITSVTTMESINDMICSLDYKNYKAEIKTADA